MPGFQIRGFLRFFRFGTAPAKSFASAATPARHNIISKGNPEMTSIRNFSTHFFAAASALALSFAMFATTVSTPSANAPVQTMSIVA